MTFCGAQNNGFSCLAVLLLSEATFSALNPKPATPTFRFRAECSGISQSRDCLGKSHVGHIG